MPIVLLVCLGIYFNQLGSWAFLDPGETYYTEAAREMVELGDWIVPHLNYQIYFSKPILTFWLIALSYKFFGVSELAARLPFAALATLLTLAGYYTVRRFQPKAALVSAVCLASAPLSILAGKTSCIDIAFSCFINIAVFATALTLFKEKSKTWPLLYICLALATLTKGPAAVLLYGLGMSVFMLICRPSKSRLLEFLKRLNLLPGILLYLLIAVPWFVLVGQATGGLFTQIFFVYENLARFMGKTNIHKGSWLYFLPVLAYGVAPWFLLLPQALKINFFAPISEVWFSGRLIKGFKSSYRPYAKDMKETSNFLSEEEAKASFTLLLSAWAISMVVFFSLSRTQLDTYILPAMAPFSILLASTMSTLAEEPKEADDPLKFDRLWFRVFLYLLSALNLLLAPAALYFSYAGRGPYVLEPQMAALSLSLIAAALRQLLLLKKKEWTKALTLSVLSVACTLSLSFPSVMGYLAYKNQDMVNLAKKLSGSDAQIFCYGAYKPSLITYLDRPVDTLSSPLAFVEGSDPSKKEKPNQVQLIMANDKDAADFAVKPKLNFEEVAREGRWACYKITNGYVLRPRTLEDSFRLLVDQNIPLWSDLPYGPLTTPLCGGDKKLSKSSN